MDLSNAILLAWVPVIFAMFLLFPIRRAIILSVLVSWLLLPVNQGEYSDVQGMIRIPGFVDLHKATLTSLFVLLCLMIFDSGRLLSFKPRLLDLPMLIWCLCPIPTGIANPYFGLYAGISGAVNQFVIWGVPYFIGRLYFSDPAGMKELAVSFIIGTLFYIPLMLIELRLSPQFHNWVYGYHQSGFEHHAREGLGGLTDYRPMVFLHSALMLGIWMTTATLLAYWLWLNKTVKTILGIPAFAVVCILAIGTLIVNAVAAIALLIFGIGLLTVVKHFKTSFLLPAAVVVILVFVGVRSTQVWSGEEIVEFVASIVNEKRAQSVGFRLQNEAPIIEKANTAPLFGKDAGFRVVSEDGKITIPDSMWVITFGRYGYVGLTALVVMMLTPAVVFWWKYPAKRWPDSPLAPGAAFAVLLVIYMIDNLANDFKTPVYIMMGGGVTGLICSLNIAKQPKRRAVAKRARKMPARRPMPTDPPGGIRTMPESR